MVQDLNEVFSDLSSYVCYYSVPILDHHSIIIQEVRIRKFKHFKVSGSIGNQRNCTFDVSRSINTFLQRYKTLTQCNVIKRARPNKERTKTRFLILEIDTDNCLSSIKLVLLSIYSKGL